MRNTVLSNLMESVSAPKLFHSFRKNIYAYMFVYMYKLYVEVNSSVLFTPDRL